MIAKANQGDTARQWTAILKIGDIPLNLTGATVVLRMSRKHPPLTEGEVAYVERAVTIVDATAGSVSYTPTEDDVAISGLYLLRWIVTYTNETQISIPTGDPIQLSLYPAP